MKRAAQTSMQLITTPKKNPRKIAEILKEELKYNELISRIEIAGPGFLNLNVNNSLWFEVILSCVRSGSQYGSLDFGKGKSAIVEYVSANPTGPLHVGHMRGAIIGDVIANLLHFVVNSGPNLLHSKIYYT